MPDAISVLNDTTNPDGTQDVHIKTDNSADSQTIRGALQTEYALPESELDLLEKVLKNNLRILCQRLHADLRAEAWDNFQQTCCTLETVAVNLNLRNLKTAVHAGRQAAKGHHSDPIAGQLEAIRKILDRLQ